jgi:hypothetical protein
MEPEFFTSFLVTVQERKGDVTERNVNAAVREAVQEWMKEKK